VRARLGPFYREEEAGTPTDSTHELRSRALLRPAQRTAGASTSNARAVGARRGGVRRRRGRVAVADLRPEPVDVEQIPEHLRAALPDLRFAINAAIEPIDPPEEAWLLLDSVLDAVGGALGGATYDIRNGRVIAWRDGQRIEPGSP
jgi:hypothetical protein